VDVRENLTFVITYEKFKECRVDDKCAVISFANIDVLYCLCKSNEVKFYETLQTATGIQLRSIIFLLLNCFWHKGEQITEVMFLYCHVLPDDASLS